MAFKAEGLGARLSARIKAAGFVNAKNEPDVPRFARDLKYERQSVYNWLKNTTPDNKSLRRLEEHLGVPWPWLLIGDEGFRAIKAWKDRGGTSVPVAHPKATKPSGTRSAGLGT